MVLGDDPWESRSLPGKKTTTFVRRGFFVVFTRVEK
jgi:hypothetical protein